MQPVIPLEFPRSMINFCEHVKQNDAMVFKNPPKNSEPENKNKSSLIQYQINEYSKNHSHNHMEQLHFEFQVQFFY